MSPQKTHGLYFSVNGSHGVGKTETLAELVRLVPWALYLEEPLNPFLGSLKGEEELIRQHRERSAMLAAAPPNSTVFSDRSGYLDVWVYLRVMQEEYGWADEKVRPTLDSMYSAVESGGIILPRAEIILVSTVEENRKRIVERVKDGKRDAGTAERWNESDTRRLELTDKYFRLAAQARSLDCGDGRTIALPDVHILDVTDITQTETARRIAKIVSSYGGPA